MARARNIKPSFFTSEQVADNCPLGRLLFIGLWTEADYHGNMEWKPRTLKVKLLPFDDCDIEQLAINLDKSGLIRFYSVDGQKYVHIPNFQRHQNPHKNERDKGSEIPKFSEEHVQVIDSKELAINPDKNGTTHDQNGTDRADSLLLIPDSLNLNTAKRKRPKPTAVDPPSGVSESTWNDWLALRNAKRAPVTQTVIDHSIQEAKKAGMTIEAFFRLWCARGSQGLEASWIKPTERATAHSGFADKDYSEGIGDDGRIL